MTTPTTSTTAAATFEAILEAVVRRVFREEAAQLGARPAEPPQPEADAAGLLTIARCCEIASCSDDLIRLEINCGRLPHVRLARRALRVKRADLTTWIAQRIVPARDHRPQLRRIGGGR